MAHMTLIFMLYACIGFSLADDHQVDQSTPVEHSTDTDYFPLPVREGPSIYEQPPPVYATAYPNFRENINMREDDSEDQSPDRPNYFPVLFRSAPSVYEQPPPVDATIYSYDNINHYDDKDRDSSTSEENEKEMSKDTSTDNTGYFPLPLGNGPSVYELPPPVDTAIYTYEETVPIGSGKKESSKKVEKIEIIGKLNRFRRTAYSGGGAAAGSSSSSQAASQSSSGSQGNSYGPGGQDDFGGIGSGPLGLSNSGAGSSSSSFSSSQAGSSAGAGGFNFPGLQGFNGGYGGVALPQIYSGGYPGYGGGFGSFPGGFGGFPGFSGASSGSSSSASSNSAGFPGSFHGFGSPGFGYNALPNVGGNSVGQGNGYGNDGGLDLFARSGSGISVPSVRSGNSGETKGVFVSSSSNVDKDGKVSYKVASGRI